MFWKEKVLKAKEFFVRGILPEMNGRWFSTPVTLSTEESAAVKGADVIEFCYCRGGEHGQYGLDVIMKTAAIRGFTQNV